MTMCGGLERLGLAARAFSGSAAQHPDEVHEQRQDQRQEPDRQCEECDRAAPAALLGETAREFGIRRLGDRDQRRAGALRVLVLHHEADHRAAAELEDRARGRQLDSFEPRLDAGRIEAVRGDARFDLREVLADDSHGVTSARRCARSPRRSQSRPAAPTPVRPRRLR